MYQLTAMWAHLHQVQRSGRQLNSKLRPLTPPTAGSLRPVSPASLQPAVKMMNMDMYTTLYYYVYVHMYIMYITLYIEYLLVHGDCRRLCMKREGELQSVEDKRRQQLLHIIHDSIIHILR